MVGFFYLQIKYLEVQRQRVAHRERGQQGHHDKN
jgi:hypothetical protein